MIIKNVTGSYQSFRLNDVPISMRPYGTAMITDEQAKDDTFKLLVARGVLAEADMDDVEKEPKPESKPRKKVEVKRQNDVQKDSTVVVKCAASLKNGNPCGGTVNVPLEKYDEEVPYFCKRHNSESAADYEKVDGEWKKKTSAIKGKRVVEEPAASESVKDTVSEEPASE